MRLSRNFAVLLLAAVSFAVLSFAQKDAQAQVVVVGGGYGAYYGGFGAYAGPVYSAPVYSAPVYAAPFYSAPYYAAPVYGGFVAPAPVAVGGFYPYPAVAPFGLYPQNGLEVNYKYRNGLWSVDIDD